MAHPVYVLLPEDTQWVDMPETSAQTPKPIRWYLRQKLPTATTQIGILVSDGPDLSLMLAQIARKAQMLGGMAIDATTQEVISAEEALPHEI